MIVSVKLNLWLNDTMQNTLEKYFCIYGGGSVRGMAYAGAIKALNELKVERVGYAGSSVGALIAVLDAFGYTSDEIIQLCRDVNFELFKDINFSFGWDIALSKGEIFYNWVKEIIERKFYGDKYLKHYEKKVLNEYTKREEIKIVIPFLLNDKIKSLISAMPDGSRPFKGSSNKSSFAFLRKYCTKVIRT